MNYADIRRLVKLVETSDIGELEIEEGGSKLKIAKRAEVIHAAPAAPAFAYPPTMAFPPAAASSTAAPSAAAPAAAPAKKLHEVQSPMVGTFYRAPSPEAPLYVQTGDAVKPGKVLCIIEAMKLMNEIEAEISGKVVEILVENAQPVEFGQVLFRIDPS